MQILPLVLVQPSKETRSKPWKTNFSKHDELQKTNFATFYKSHRKISLTKLLTKICEFFFKNNFVVIFFIFLFFGINFYAQKSYV